MQPVLTAEQMRAMDAQTISDLGIPGVVLMETAGRAVAHAALRILGQRSHAEPQVVVLCGVGNNAGDGFVAARVLKECGIACEVFLVLGKTGIRGDAATFLDAYRLCDGTIAPLSKLDQALANATLIVDAIFGTGLCREVDGELATLFSRINDASVSVLAIDIPSGLRADDGAVLGACIDAQVTVVMAAAKIGNVTAPGFAHCGRTSVAEIGIPSSRTAAVARVFLIELSDVHAAMPGVQLNGHKGQRGHALIVAGSPGKQGAGRLAALAALRAGAGLVTLVGPSQDGGAADPIMTQRVATPSELDEALVGKAALLLGPGMDAGPTGAALVRHALAKSDLPIVLDAGALTHLASDLRFAFAAKGPLVLTPHPGEAGRLLGIATAAVQADRIAAIRQLARDTGALVILKGARTCICDGRAHVDLGVLTVRVSDVGGPELATAGTGDVLAGMVTALLAQGLDIADAAMVAVHWHGVAGGLAQQQLGGPGCVVSDVIAAIPKARERR